MSLRQSPVTAYVALGANLGDARAAVLQAMQNIAALPATVLVRRSTLYRTTPVDSTGPDYINAVVEVRTGLGPQDLLFELQQLEIAGGRERPYPNAPRTLDLDILLYGDECIDSPTLVLPHPRMTARGFVLVPLAEIAPSRVRAAQLLAVADQRVNAVPDC